MIGLIVSFGAHLSACKNEEEEARRRALQEARIQSELEETRRKARNDVEGKSMDILQTLDGKTYHDVEIRKASAIGISIRHTAGTARVPYEKLPKAMQKSLYFDPDEKEDAVEREQEQQAVHSQALAASHTEMLKDKRQKKATLDQGERRRLQSALSSMASAASQIERELQSIEFELSEDRRSTDRARYYKGVGSVSRAPIIRERLEAKRQQLNSVRRKEAALRAELRR